MKIGSYIAVTLLLFSAWIPVTAQAGEPPASATGPTQTLSAVLKDTWQTNPSLLAARAGQKAIEEALPQAQAGWKPLVGVDASLSRLDPAGSALDARTPKDVGVSEGIKLALKALAR